MPKSIVIEGSHIHDIPSFYEEINRVFMRDEEWKIGQNLDAFNDLLYGGYGAIRGNEAIILIWKDFEKNRKDLGFELTKAYYLEKLKSPSLYNTDFVQGKLNDLLTNNGQTYFDILLEIINEHPNIELVGD